MVVVRKSHSNYVFVIDSDSESQVILLPNTTVDCTGEWEVSCQYSRIRTETNASINKFTVRGSHIKLTM